MILNFLRFSVILARLHERTGTTIVTWTSALVWASPFKALRQSFYVMGKVLSGELSCTRTGLVTTEMTFKTFHLPSVRRNPFKIGLFLKKIICSLTNRKAKMKKVRITSYKTVPVFVPVIAHRYYFCQRRYISFQPTYGH